MGRMREMSRSRMSSDTLAPFKRVSVGGVVATVASHPPDGGRESVTNHKSDR